MILKVNNPLKLPDVSRETKFREYFELLQTWNKSLSLMKLLSYEDFYNRHILDAVQLAPHLDISKKIYDFGSGAGIPGIILSILGFDVVLIESTTKKTIFLNHVAKTLALSATIYNGRIETMKIDNGIVVARALSSLTELIGYLDIVSRETIGVFLKGETLVREIEKAEKFWKFDYEAYKSITGSGYVVKIYGIESV